MNFDLIFALLVAVAALGGFGLGWWNSLPIRDELILGWKTVLEKQTELKEENIQLERDLSLIDGHKCVLERQLFQADHEKDRLQSELSEQTVATESWAAKAKQHWIAIHRVEGELEGCRKANAILSAHKPVYGLRASNGQFKKREI